MHDDALDHIHPDDMDAWADAVERRVPLHDPYATISMLCVRIEALLEEKAQLQDDLMALRCDNRESD